MPRDAESANKPCERVPAKRTALLAGALSALAMVACSRPSDAIDGGDLLGVFEHDAATDGGAPDASSDAGTKSKSKAPRGSADAGAADSGGAASDATAAPAVSRAPTDAICVTPSGTPTETRRNVGRPACRDAQVLETRDSSGSPRYACAFIPRGIEARSPLPLVVFFHDALDDPTSVDKQTWLRKLGARFDLSKDPAHSGFVVLAPQGRALKGHKGTTFDTEHVAVDDADVATVDHFLGVLEDRKLVDRRRVYALGAGTGGLMAATWSMLRADRVAAFGVYASAAPSAAWSCAGPPPPAFAIYRACDAVTACDGVERWLRARDAVSADTAFLRLGSFLEEEPTCAVTKKCTKDKGETNHARWPRGREGEFLRFFARHTLAVDTAKDAEPKAPVMQEAP